MGKPPGAIKGRRRWAAAQLLASRDCVTLAGRRPISAAMARDTAPHLHRPWHLLPRWRFPHRPVAPGRPRADHAWPFRPRPARPSRLPLHRQARPRHPPSPRPDRASRRIGYGERRRSAASPSPSTRPATSPAPPRSGSSGRARSGSSRATTRPTPDGLSEPFEPVPCDTFITECTFGLPVFRWEPQAQVMERGQPLVGGQRRRGARLDPRGLCASARRSA